ncbi:hypothetical protein V9T40_004276 [Parthenolecanium corni]|uniref:Cuticle protein n=1 Tax=Parthenolecanium corni TaxID=536013 RepID=A0AAN9TTQ8_9HEMI
MLILIIKIILAFAFIASTNAGLLPAAAPIAYTGLPAYPYTFPVPAAYSALPYRSVAPVAPAVYPASPFRADLPALPAAAAIAPVVRTALPAAPLVKAAPFTAPVFAPVAAPVAAPLAVAPVAAAKIDYADAYPQYQYAYNIQDTLTGDSKTQEETREGGVVKGRYSLIDADGSRRTVSYYADPLNGFNAVVQKDLPIVAAPVVKAAPAIVSV